MEETKKLIQKRRFKGFQNEEEWKKCKLGRVANYRRGSFPQPYGKTEWYDGEGAMPFVQVADVSKNMNLINDTKQKISRLAQPMSIFAEKNSVLVTLQGSIGRVAITQYGAYVDRTVLIFESYNMQIDTVFWAYIIKQKFEIEAQKAPGGTIKTITKEALSDFDLMIPEYHEQKRIGEYFKRFDNLITLQQRKLEKIKSMKKAYLYEMFPAEGESKPKRRFKGFTDEWTTCTLGENAKYRRGSFPQPYGNKEWYDGENSMPFVQVVDVNNHLSLVDQTKQMISAKAQPYSVFVKKNSVVVTLQGSIGRVAITQYDSYVDRTLLIFEGYKNKTDLRFWAYTIQNIFDTEKKMAPGGTIKTITKEALSKFHIMIPNYEEQFELGCFLDKLDNLITLHQSKLDKLKNLKKAYLNEMFI